MSSTIKKVGYSTLLYAVGAGLQSPVVLADTVCSMPSFEHSEWGDNKEECEYLGNEFCSKMSQYSGYLICNMEPGCSGKMPSAKNCHGHWDDDEGKCWLHLDCYVAS